jgi:hypothetical protein
MFRLFVGLATFLVACIASAPLTPARAGHAPVVVYEVVLPPPPPIVYQVVLPPPAAIYYPYPYGHWYRPPHTWYGRPWPAYSRHYQHRRYARSKKKKQSAGKSDSNWHYCRSYWRYPEYMGEKPTTREVAGRFWWPYYNPRPIERDPCNYQNNKITVKTPPPYRAY